METNARHAAQRIRDAQARSATQGPWKVSPPLGPGDFAVLSDKVNAYGNFYVAVIPNGAHAEAEANARLIAAAPRMLEALQRLSLLAPSSEGLGGHAPLVAFIEEAHRARAILRDVDGAS